MEPRRTVHQSDNKAGGMVSHRGITDLSRLPLLPFERELVATLGCTEAEYRAFTIEAMKRSRVRPAAYDGVPDIRKCDPSGGIAYILASALPLAL
jgi:hypothetical protein